MHLGPPEIVARPESQVPVLPAQVRPFGVRSDGKTLELPEPVGPTGVLKEQGPNTKPTTDPKASIKTYRIRPGGRLHPTVVDGAEPDVVKLVTLSAAVTNFVNDYGEEATAGIVESLPEKIRNGAFSQGSNQPDSSTDSE